MARSSAATGMISLRTTLAPLLLGVVAGPTQVGLFRIAQAPQTGFSGCSAPGAADPAHRADARLGARPAGTPSSGRPALHARRRRSMVVAVPVFMVADAVADRARLRRASTRARSTRRGSCSSPRRSNSCSGGRRRSRSRSGGPACGSSRTASRRWSCSPRRWSSAPSGASTGAAVATLVSVVAFAAMWAVLLVRVRADVDRRTAPTTSGGASAA